MSSEAPSPIAAHAAIGDGRTVALIDLEGTIDWLTMPYVDSPTVFVSLLDPRGGQFELHPDVPFEARRRYVDHTNVLETTFTTSSGTARVTDALTVPSEGLAPSTELVRKVEGLSGEVPFSWKVDPRFDYSIGRTALGKVSGIPVATCGSDALAVMSWDCGEAAIGGTVEGRFETGPGSVGALSLSYANGEPLIFPSRDDVDRRLSSTIARWQEVVQEMRYDGPWRDEVLRSGLVLNMLVSSPYGSFAAAPTTSLPEVIGGDRNWDYRFCWVRDSAFAMNAFLSLGAHREAEAFFWWLMHASQLTHPHLNVLYRLDGGTHAPEVSLPLDGYEGSRPVRIGNGALEQTQLDIYGDLLETAWLYSTSGHAIDREVAGRLAEIADLLCDIWRQPDSGLWEVRVGPLQFTQSKMMCAVALARATSLAEIGVLPMGRRWRATEDQIRTFVEEGCWSQDLGTYVRSAGSNDLDAGTLLAVIFGYADPKDPRILGTIEAIHRGLRHGPHVMRYTGDDGLKGTEGAFVACSFWLVEALARTGRIDDAESLMNDSMSLANDVGLFSEEVDPGTGELLGNFPQALSHLALISAAAAVETSRR